MQSFIYTVCRWVDAYEVGRRMPISKKNKRNKSGEL